MGNNRDHVSRNLDFTDDLKSFHNWWSVFKDSLENENDKWIKEYKLDNYILFLKQFLPNKTKIMGRAFLKDVIEIEDHRLLILISHLYFENFIEEIIKNRLNYSSRTLNLSFYQKLEFLYTSEIIDDFYYSELRFINNLRNSYAHNLCFDVLDYDFNKSPELKSLKILKKYRSKRAKRKLYNFIIRIYLTYILFALSHDFREIYLLDSMKNK